MSSIQIYYTYPDRMKKGLDRMGIDLDIIVRKGSYSFSELYKEIKKDANFCRKEESINYKHFLSLIISDITLYAILDEVIAGALNFMFNERNGNRIIIFDGICSPDKYSGQRVGQELINTLIRIGKTFDVRYIYLECKGNVMNYYRNKFGFEVVSTKMSYDSDNSDDEDELYYNMRLDLSNISGGKIRKRNKSIKRRKLKKI
jgi:hypothetical protein